MASVIVRKNGIDTFRRGNNVKRNVDSSFHPCLVIPVYKSAAYSIPNSDKPYGEENKRLQTIVDNPGIRSEGKYAKAPPINPAMPLSMVRNMRYEDFLSVVLKTK